MPILALRHDVKKVLQWWVADWSPMVPVGTIDAFVTASHLNARDGELHLKRIAFSFATGRVLSSLRDFAHTVDDYPPLEVVGPAGTKKDAVVGRKPKTRALSKTRKPWHSRPDSIQPSPPEYPTYR
jgi:hypothetical protein